MSHDTGTPKDFDGAGDNEEKVLSLLEIVQKHLPRLKGKEIVVSVTEAPEITFGDDVPKKLKQISEMSGYIVSAAIQINDANQETLVCKILLIEQGIISQNTDTVSFVLADYVCYIDSPKTLSFSSRRKAMKDWQTVTIG